MTFLELINAVLREVNEVELTTIGSSRGIQTSVKDFINKAQRDIINSEVEWPFTIVSGTITTVAGQAEYTKPTNTKTIDFDSFTVQESASTSEKTLSYLSFEEYVERYNEIDTNPSGNSHGLPEYVYLTPDDKIGFSPVPDLSLIHI